MDTVFDVCVTILTWMAAVTGLTYKQVNVILFFGVFPGACLLPVGYIWWLRRAVNRNHHMLQQVVADVAHPQVQAVIAIAQKDAAAQAVIIHDAAQAEGRVEGFSKGKTAGLAEGRECGRQTAFYKMAESLGLVRNESVPPEPPADWEFDWGPHPNVYWCRGAWVVRVIVAGQRLTQSFPFTESRTLISQGHQSIYEVTYHTPTGKAALAQAVRWRNLHVQVQDSDQHLFMEVFDRIINEGAQHLHLESVRLVAAEYHRRLQLANTHHQAGGLLGDDPEARFSIEDTTILVLPWTSLFEEKPVMKYIEAFEHVGLRTWGENARTVRDLLLVTPAEFLAVPGFGPQALATLQEGLRNYEVALWGEDVPAPPAPTHRGRNLRAIDLDSKEND